MFVDANDEFWCLCITQCKDGDQLLPWAEQVGKHRPLLFESGRFRKAQLNWHTVSIVRKRSPMEKNCLITNTGSTAESLTSICLQITKFC